jgi:hypothetical protein
MTRTRLRLTALFATLTMAATFHAHAHELPENRATLVMRDANHVSMTLYIALTQTLHRALAPQRSFQEFALAYSAMTPESFQAALLKAERRLQGEVRVASDDGQALVVERWSWPEPARVQAALRERAMQTVVAPADHGHEAPMEVRAEVQATQAIRTVHVSFPRSFQRVLVVSYRPKQMWVDAAGASGAITF